MCFGWFEFVPVINVTQEYRIGKVTMILDFFRQYITGGCVLLEYFIS